MIFPRGKAPPSPAAASANNSGDSNANETASAAAASRKVELPYGWGNRHGKAPPHPMFDPASVSPSASASANNSGDGKLAQELSRDANKTASAAAASRKVELPYGWGSRHGKAPPQPMFDPASVSSSAAASANNSGDGRHADRSQHIASGRTSSAPVPAPPSTVTTPEPLAGTDVQVDMLKEVQQSLQVLAGAVMRIHEKMDSLEALVKGNQTQMDERLREIEHNLAHVRLVMSPGALLATAENELFI